MTKSEDEDKANSRRLIVSNENKERKTSAGERERRHEERRRCSGRSAESEIDYAPPCIIAVIICYPSRARAGCRQPRGRRYRSCVLET